MTEEKTQGIVLKLIDYKDANKLASIFTFNNGIVTAKFAGVKKEKAKLKAIAQPFAFADFTFGQLGVNKTVMGANIIDNFYQILLDYNKTICGYVVLDIIKTLLPENQPEQDMFLISVASLKNIETQNEYVATIDFMLKFLNFSGVGMEFPEGEHVFLDKSTGDFNTNRTAYSIEIDKRVYLMLKEIAFNPDSCLNIGIGFQTTQTVDDEAKLQEQYKDGLDNKTELNYENNISAHSKPTPSLNILKQCMRLLGNIIYIRFNTEIKSLHFI